MRRQKAIEQAVQAADEIILDASDGSCEETAFLTSAVAVKFAEKVHQVNSSALLRREF
jgi:hypothetical protein